MQSTNPAPAIVQTSRLLDLPGGTYQHFFPACPSAQSLLTRTLSRTAEPHLRLHKRRLAIRFRNPLPQPMDRARPLFRHDLSPSPRSRGPYGPPPYDNRTPTYDPFQRSYLALTQVCRRLPSGFSPILEASTRYGRYVKVDVAREYIETFIFGRGRGRGTQSITEVKANFCVTFREVGFMAELDDLVALLRRAPGLRLSLMGGWRMRIYDLEAIKFFESRMDGIIVKEPTW
jgi:hypothetical protein